jgi:ParB family chromosome partitioning protein
LAEVEPAEEGARPDRTVPIEALTPNPDQPRKSFPKEALEELATSIGRHGIIQPIVVRQAPDGGYQIVAGERRWRAAQIAQVHEVPIVVREMSDTDVLEVAIVENVQRADLDPIEEAMAYRQLVDRFGHTQEELAAVLGRSRSHIANMLRLLLLPKDVREMLVDGRLTMGHARTLVTVPDASGLARQIVSRGLTVRQAEALANEGRASASPARPARRTGRDADTDMLEREVAAATGAKVAIQHGSRGSGKIVLRYKDVEHLDDIVARIRGFG